MIKNAIAYNVEMPNVVEMMEFILGDDGVYLSRKPDVGQISTIGFSHHPVTHEYVSEFEGGFCLVVKVWEKKLDNGAINAKLTEFEHVVKTNEGRSLTTKEKQQFKEDLISALLPNILPTPKLTFAYYHLSSNTLIVDTTSDKTSNEVTSLLRKAIGSLKATTLYIDNKIGLTETIAECLDHKDRNIFGKTLIDNTIELKGGDTNGSLKFKNVDLFDDTTTEEIVGQIREGGMYVKSINLTNTEHETNYELTDGFKLKSFNFAFANDDEDDVIHMWKTDTFYCVGVIKDIINEITKHFTVVEE